CGVHGRFEYCIDDITGCVIGCHCHPGYYFDTDTKICEPNIKLTQDFRRHYHPELTQTHVAPTTHPPEEPTTDSNAVDEKIDEITKDADELGDWLYNQFFKTIENQVINKTQGAELPPTRRSSNVLLNKPARRSHKYWRSRKKKKRKSKSKSKLLRITENDSLFDSDASSGSEDDSDSSSESDVSRSVEDKHDKKKNDDHDHKKIIIYNKKPQPPLPSFIFLPNMDTPYYPPIGLPPPPAMPMYPMVPVPPMVPGPVMGGPLFPYPGVPHTCEDSSSLTSNTTTAAKVSEDEKPAPITVDKVSADEKPALITVDKVSKDKKPAPITVDKVSEDEKPALITVDKVSEDEKTAPITVDKVSKDKKPALITVDKVSEDKKPALITVDKVSEDEKTAPITVDKVSKDIKPALITVDKVSEDEKPALVTVDKVSEDEKTAPITVDKLKKLREKFNRKNKLESFLIDQYQDQSDAPLDGNDPSEFIRNRNLMRLNEMHPPPRDVDFKYLAELIHTNDLNKTLNTQPNPRKEIKKYDNIPLQPLPSRRSYYPIDNVNNRPMNNVMRQRSRMEYQNDSFYTNLGKQIASMIRNLDTTGEREVNIQIEGDNSKLPSQTSSVFNGDHYASRSYWDRSVRSPLKYMGTVFNKERNNLVKSNEDLFSLENKVEIAASTTPTLSLHDLENIVNNVKNEQLKPKRNSIYSKTSEHSNTSLKLNLLPGNLQRDSNDTIQPNYIAKPKPVQILAKEDSDIIKKLDTRRKQSDVNSFLLSHFRQLSPDYESIKNTGTLFQNMGSTKKPSAENKPNEITLQTHPNSNTIRTKGAANKTNFNYRLSPIQLNQRSYNYHPYRKNQYIYEKALPIQNTGFRQSLVPYGKYYDKPSYFHHEFHHFDYFDR
ncbi:hypothetical protein OBRU01_18273, partial [Operophtera brumata]